METSQELVARLIRQAAANHLYGEITLRFRDGELIFVIEEKTTPVGARRVNHSFSEVDDDRHSR